MFSVDSSYLIIKFNNKSIDLKRNKTKDFNKMNSDNF